MGRLLKLPFGPITSPKPGPTLDIAEADPDRAVTKSKPFKDKSVAKIKKIKKYQNINVIIELTKLSVIFSLLYLIKKIPRG